MTDAELFSSALRRLRESWATASVPERVSGAEYNRRIGERVCRLMFEKCGGDGATFGAALRDFIDLSEEFVRLQVELDASGHYRHSSYDEVRAMVYNNPDVMEHRYLNGLLLSYAFWANHTKILEYFVREFCETAPARGRLLEVPSGTGLFVSEFARRNPDWVAEAIDISESAVAFGQEIARIHAAGAPTIGRRDVFSLTRDHAFDRIVCGELLEHLERPIELLDALRGLVAPGGTIFLTTAVWAANIDHIYLFTSAQEVREMLEPRFRIESELALAVRDGRGAEEPRTPINYACILSAR